ncbi:MAG: hypothetical protein IJ537_09375 [Bacteroidaceae bacterium]|nr:hypothetical protein [Bacteroidaceae bacterium]MBQ8455527.1 hypothetical protein [Bacteroidaceae bacterium]MBQ9295195.1 hypothetical protein [Bacteroidaceae bacterium]
MKKTYMMPTSNVEQAQPTNIIAVSIKGGSDTGLVDGGGSTEPAHIKEDIWNIWGEE